MSKKLRLNKDTLRTLGRSELAAANGASWVCPVSNLLKCTEKCGSGGARATLNQCLTAPCFVTDPTSKV